MSETAHVDQLLAHTDWLRALARRLVGSATADDVVQDTLIAAMRSPPDIDRPPRPWLARVMRNVARKRYRSDSRRTLREDVAALTPVASTAPDEIVQLLETHRMLCEIVLGLDEPYRSTLVLHYYEGRSLAEIARQQLVPDATVRWRHNQALQLVRTQLDHRADGHSWVATLAPIVAPPSKTATVVAGGMIVKSLAIGLCLAIIAVGIATSLVPALPAMSPPTTDGRSSSPAAIADRDSQPSGHNSKSNDHRFRMIDPDARTALMHRIHAARASGTQLAAAPYLDGPPPLPGELSPDQVLEAVMAVNPMLKECYRNGLDRRTIKDGTVDFDIRLIGAPEIGTLVDSADLGGDPAFLADAELAQCLHETMMSIELPPMKEGSDTEFKTTIRFSENGEAEDAR